MAAHPRGGLTGRRRVRSCPNRDTFQSIRDNINDDARITGVNREGPSQWHKARLLESLPPAPRWVAVISRLIIALFCISNGKKLNAKAH